MLKANPLSLVSYALMVAGFLIGQELQRREIKETVEEVLTEREARSQGPAPASS